MMKWNIYLKQWTNPQYECCFKPDYRDDGLVCLNPGIIKFYTRTSSFIQTFNTFRRSFSEFVIIFYLQYNLIWNSLEIQKFQATQ